MLEIVIVSPYEVLSGIEESISDFKLSLGNSMTGSIQEQCNKMQEAIRTIETELEELNISKNGFLREIQSYLQPNARL